jgi:putative endonuclease
MHNRILGKQGEDFACAYVEQDGMQILTRNFRGKRGEIDFIARDGDTVVFVEVKTRSNRMYGAPCEAVDYFKIKKIRDTAQEYAMKNQLYGENFRFDVAEVYRDEGGFRIHYMKNAF